MVFPCSWSGNNWRSTRYHFDLANAFGVYLAHGIRWRVDCTLSVVRSVFLVRHPAPIVYIHTCKIKRRAAEKGLLIPCHSVHPHLNLTSSEPSWFDCFICVSHYDRVYVIILSVRSCIEMLILSHQSRVGRPRPRLPQLGCTLMFLRGILLDGLYSISK